MMTLEELRSQKKAMHLTAFRHFVEDELLHDLRRIAEEKNASERYAMDLRTEKDGVVHTVEDLLLSIIDAVKSIVERHEKIHCKR